LEKRLEAGMMVLDHESLETLVSCMINSISNMMISDDFDAELKESTRWLAVAPGSLPEEI
jgi:hypothetical protein